MKLNEELKDFEYRERTILADEIFPRFNPKSLRMLFGGRTEDDPNQLVLQTALCLWRGGYGRFLDEFGFWDSAYKEFSGHCHQITPILGVVLKSFGFSDVAYLECRRVKDLETYEAVPPEEEPNPDMRQEFCDIGRIPYCTLEFKVPGKEGEEEVVYMTGKHLKPDNGGAIALLSPNCYRARGTEFAHQDDPTRSGIYLDVTKGPNGEIIWKKQNSKDPTPELFMTYLKMNIKL